jgi:hypothetical protein
MLAIHLWDARSREAGVVGSPIVIATLSKSFSTASIREPGLAHHFQDLCCQGWVFVRKSARVSLGRELGVNAQKILCRSTGLFVTAQGYIVHHKPCVSVEIVGLAREELLAHPDRVFV